MADMPIPTTVVTAVVVNTFLLKTVLITFRKETLFFTMFFKCFTPLAVPLKALNFLATFGRRNIHFFHAAIAWFYDKTSNTMNKNESTVCLFSTGTENCVGKKNTHLNNLICAKHLKQYYGLEIYADYTDRPTYWAYAGWVLRPAPGVHFKPNDVIIPVREFIDKTYRPESNKKLNSEKIYSMNPVFDAFMRSAADTTKMCKNDRFTYEILRNLSQNIEDVDLNSIQNCEKNPKSTSLIRSKIAVSETFIQQHSVMSYLNGISLYTTKEATDHLIHLKDMDNLSLCYKYFLSKAEYSSHIVMDVENVVLELNRINFNAMFFENIGLVATKHIDHPHTIVAFGTSRGIHEEGASEGFYEENVLVYPKEMVHQNVSPYMLPQQNAIRRTLMTGPNCI